VIASLCGTSVVGYQTSVLTGLTPGYLAVRRPPPFLQTPVPTTIRRCCSVKEEAALLGTSGWRNSSLCSPGEMTRAAQWPLNLSTNLSCCCKLAGIGITASRQLCKATSERCSSAQGFLGGCYRRQKQAGSLVMVLVISANLIW